MPTFREIGDAVVDIEQVRAIVRGTNNQSVTIIFNDHKQLKVGAESAWQAMNVFLPPPLRKAG